MGEFKSFLYTDTGTEITFMQGLIDLICGLDTNITCVDVDGNPTTAAAQFDGIGGHYAVFIFKFGDTAKFVLFRNRQNIENQSCYNYLPNYPSESGVAYLKCAASNYAYNATATRNYFVAYYKGDNVVALWLGQYSVSAIINAQCSALLLKTSNDCYGGGVASTNPLSAILYNSDSSITYSPAFAYSAGAGNIDYIEKSVFVSGNTKVTEIADIKSCSTVPQFSSIALPNGKNYFAISTNAMVEITPEEEEQEETLEGQSDSVPSMQ